VSLEARYPEESGPEALEGTAAHHVATHLLTTGELLPAGRVCPNGVLVDHPMQEAVVMYSEHVLARLPSVRPRTHLKVEQRISCGFIHEQCWGTFDAALIEGQVIDVWDFKYGHDYVEAFENWQLLCYAAGILEEILRVTPNAEPYITVNLHVVQPRSYHPSGPIRTWTIRAVDLRPYFNILQGAAARTFGDPQHLATLVGRHCKDCSARRACPGATAAAYDAVALTGTAVPFDLSPGQAGRELQTLRQASERLDARITGLEAQVTEHIRRGQYVPFWQLGSTTPRIRWKCSADEVILMGDLNGVDLRKTDVITPVQASKLGIDESVISSYSFRPNGEIKLVPMDTTEARKVFSK
jgi:hypothetical protein